MSCVNHQPLRLTPSAPSLLQFSNFERAVARLLWEMDIQGIQITEKSLADFSGRCSPPIVWEPFLDALQVLHKENLIVLSLKARLGLYVRYVSPTIQEIFGTQSRRFPTSALPEPLEELEKLEGPEK